MNALKTLWHESGPFLRRFFGISVGIGVVLVVVGVVGDVRHWWDELAFTTNVVSTLTSAAFGIPLALVVFQHISRLQVEGLERRSRIRSAVRSGRQLKEIVRQLSPDPAEDWPQIVTDTEASTAQIEATRTALADTGLAAAEKARGFITACQDWRTTHRARCAVVPGSGEAMETLVRFASQWEFHKGFSRSSLAEADVTFARHEWITAIDELSTLIQTGGPGTVLPGLDVDYQQTSVDNAIRDVRADPDTVDTYARTMFFDWLLAANSGGLEFARKVEAALAALDEIERDLESRANDT
ncbi:hypothetical protein GCM10009557_68620 [Virgisporangium ochraceum]|uniref:Uncharacterized protein n=1 Tax=Virgisporangium ochraceum TaxID=65505 RepID=A0A8J4A239_9ACTN|nr:hypothetical protein [Virgisporangium ochraceum]GIJ74299.1 hypothetical protein Voc01_092160 [Virgisporangium ochraceum]